MKSIVKKLRSKREELLETLASMLDYKTELDDCRRDMMFEQEQEREIQHRMQEEHNEDIREMEEEISLNRLLILCHTGR